MRPLENELREGLQSLSLELPDAAVGALLEYLGLIQKWTKVYNLTAVRDPAEMLTHHLLDSLAVIEPLRRELDQMARDGLSTVAPTLLDVGSGAGLPGVVIAIVIPELQVHCVDTVAKKAAFIQQVAASLRLANLRGIHARVEGLQQKYAVVSSRAFASLSDFTAWSSAALSEKGVWMAMKGKIPEQEIGELSADVQVFHVEQIQVPGLKAERCIVWMRKPE